MNRVRLDVCPVSSSRSRSGNHLDHLRAISQKFDFFAFLSVFVKVFSSFSFRFVEITADDCLIIEDYL